MQEMERRNEIVNGGKRREGEERGGEGNIMMR